VFRAFTAPAQLVKWRGPKGFTVPACTFETEDAHHGHRRGSSSAFDCLEQALAEGATA
jgi:uncharacterized protein YndB with AHSA1/START domain